MKKWIVWCLVLLGFVALYMNHSSSEYRPVSDDHKWVCSKPEGWLLRKDGHIVGQLTLGDEIKNIEFDWMNGHPAFFFGDQFGWPVFIYESFPSEGEKAPDEVLLFRGRGYFHKKSFRVAVSQEYVDVIGYRNLKFRQVELDEADRAFQAADTKPLNSTEDDFTQREHIEEFEMVHQEYYKSLQALLAAQPDDEEVNRSEAHMEEAEMRRVKLTITESRCRSGYFEKGQEFIVEDLCPPLCHELWNNIYPLVYALQNGAELDYGDVRAKMFDAVCPDECRVCIHGELMEA